MEMSERADLLENIKMAELAIFDVENDIRSRKRQIEELDEELTSLELELLEKENHLTQLGEELEKMDAEIPIPELITYDEDTPDPLDILYPSEFEKEDKANE